jgi:hypothetical protein
VRNFVVIDLHTVIEIKPVARRRIGPELVFGRLWKESGIPEALQSTLKTRRYEFEVKRAIYLTVLHRLFASGSDRATDRWREDYLIPAIRTYDVWSSFVSINQCTALGVTLTNRRSRASSSLLAMGFLGDPFEPEGERILPQRPRSGSTFGARTRSICLPKWTWSFRYFDSTSLYFAGCGGETIGQRGHNKIIGPI